MKKSALGRGLDVLLPDISQINKNEILEIDINDIDRNTSQPRRSFDQESIRSLSESIRTAGILQPLLVAEVGGRYRIIAGERRFRAARMAGLEKVPCIVCSYSQTQEMEAALIENLQREDLNPVDEAKAINALIERCGYTQETAAQRLGKSRSALTNLLRILKLHPDVLSLVAEGKLSEGHARVLAGISDEHTQRAYAQRAVMEEMSVRALEKLAQAAPVRKPEKPKTKAPEISDFEERMLRAVGVKTVVQGNVKRGKVILQYHSTEELELIYDVLEKLENG
ncbi:MAG: hypothetical protein CW338_01850 [Clostridiales bacterium]|nr:hypothetical protein [Clostridiales bacterium]